MPRKRVTEEVEITVWPSSLPEGIGSIAPPGTELSVEYEDLGSRYLADAVEQSSSAPVAFADEYDDTDFDPGMVEGLLRSFGLAPPPKRSRTRTLPPPARRARALAAPGLPDDLEELMGPMDEIDLTEQSIHEASLLDHEGEEAGEVESPLLRTEDTRTHGKPRGGHARTSLRPPARQKR